MLLGVEIEDVDAVLVLIDPEVAPQRQRALGGVSSSRWARSGFEM